MWGVWGRGEQAGEVHRTGERGENKRVSSAELPSPLYETKETY